MRVRKATNAKTNFILVFCETAAQLMISCACFAHFIWSISAHLLLSRHVNFYKYIRSVCECTHLESICLDNSRFRKKHYLHISFFKWNNHRWDVGGADICRAIRTGDSEKVKPLLSCWYLCVCYAIWMEY